MTGSKDSNLPIAIVGGGPAGLATATILARKKLPVIVVEKKVWPIDKVCGEGIMPSGVRILQSLGVLKYLKASESFPFKGIRYFNEEGPFATGNFSCRTGLGMRRITLSHAFYETAYRSANITLWPKTTLNSLNMQDNCVQIGVLQNNKQTQIKASLVIGADGMRSRVRHLASLQGTPPLRFKRWGVRQHFAIAPWSDYVDVHWSRNLEAYVTPVSPHSVQIAFLWRGGRLSHIAGGPALIFDLLERFPLLEHRLARARPLSRVTATGPLAHSAAAASKDRVLLLGDALGFLDGITGEGISCALHQAMALGDTLPALLGQNQADRSSLALLGKRLEKIQAPHFRMTKAALFLSRHPGLRRMFIRGLARSPQLFKHLLESNMGYFHPLCISFFELPDFLRGICSRPHHTLEKKPLKNGHIIFDR